MPVYDFRCRKCEQQFTLRFATLAQYEAAEPVCPACGAHEPARLITSLAFAKSQRDYRRMSSQEMLSVLESGDSKQVDEMHKQVGDISDSAG